MGRRFPRSSVFLAWTVLIALVTAACGSRVSDEQKAAGIAVLAGSGAGTDGAGTASGAATDEAGTDAATGTDDDAATGSGDGATANGGGATGTAGGGSSEQGGGSGTQSPGAARCKPGGNSDTGVTSKQLTVAVVSDITGPSPGLFKSTHEAVQAYANYVNSRGGVCGRSLKVLKLDSKTDSGGNRAAVLDACSKAFALVGSMSAFDDGGASAIADCKVPDVTAIPTSPERVNGEWSYPVFPNRQDLVAVGSPTYVARQFPDAVKKAGILWLNAAVTRNNANARRAAWESVGFEFVYDQEVQVVEANYTPFVLDMKDKGVDYVTVVADINSISRLMKAARQQDFTPKVWDWDSVAYDPDFITISEGAAEGSYVFLNSALFEEAGGNPEMSLYKEWLAKTAPGSQPDYFGGYAWSAAALFVAKTTALGADPTRAKLKDALAATASWDGNGMHGAHKVGQKIPTTCFNYVRVQGNAFTRAYPSSGFDCNLAGHWRK